MQSDRVTWAASISADPRYKSLEEYAKTARATFTTFTHSGSLVTEPFLPLPTELQSIGLSINEAAKSLLESDVGTETAASIISALYTSIVGEPVPTAPSTSGATSSASPGSAAGSSASPGAAPTAGPMMKVASVLVGAAAAGLVVL